MAKAKKKTSFFCKECGFESPKWLGQCPGCQGWDTFVEAPVNSVMPGVGKPIIGKEKEHVPSKLSEVKSDEEERIITGIGELDRVLGGGIVVGSLVLVGGDPGIG